MKSKMKTVVITRKYWGQRSLRRDDGKRCCLGFCSESYGIAPKDTLNMCFPIDLVFCKVKGYSKLPTWLIEGGIEVHDVNSAAGINDDSSLTMTEKEERLKPLFAKHNIRLVFRGKP